MTISKVPRRRQKCRLKRRLKKEKLFLKYLQFLPKDYQVGAKSRMFALEFL